MKSPKELSLERKLYTLLDPKSHASTLIHALTSDDEIQALQDYANNVSILRLGYNDHGPVHMRQVAYNAIQMMYLLKEAQIQGSLEHDKVGDFDDSLCAVILASFLHDLGMSVGRDDHEIMSAVISMPIIDRILMQVYSESIVKRVIVRSLALEGIVGHMASRKIHSMEAGVILLADGCDMEKGRARIPLSLHTVPRIGDIHKYSANSIEKVQIGKGNEKPISITVDMSAEVGFFQIEEVLFPKINSSPVKPYIELYAGVTGSVQKRYL